MKKKIDDLSVLQFLFDAISFESKNLLCDIKLPILINYLKNINMCIYKYNINIFKNDIHRYEKLIDLFYSNKIKNTLNLLKTHFSNFKGLNVTDISFYINQNYTENKPTELNLTFVTSPKDNDRFIDIPDIDENNKRYDTNQLNKVLHTIKDIYYTKNANKLITYEMLSPVTLLEYDVPLSKDYEILFNYFKNLNDIDKHFTDTKITQFFKDSNTPLKNKFIKCSVSDYNNKLRLFIYENSNNKSSDKELLYTILTEFIENRSNSKYQRNGITCIYESQKVGELSSIELYSNITKNYSITNKKYIDLFTKYNSQDIYKEMIEKMKENKLINKNTDITIKYHETENILLITKMSTIKNK